MNNRRNFIIAGALLPVVGTLHAEEQCTLPLASIAVENDANIETQFFEHYHILLVPAAALIALPADGIKLQTTAVDQGSLNEESFKEFTKNMTDANAIEKFRTHSHEVLITQAQLKEIATGKEVVVRVISANNNFVHEFLIKASPSALARVGNAHA